MIPAKYEDQVREMAAQDGRETAANGGTKDDCQWMPGTIFFLAPNTALYACVADSVFSGENAGKTGER